MERFVCGRNNLHLGIKPEVLERLEIQTPEQLHLEWEKIWCTAQEMQQAGWASLPFCNTLCSEGLGAHPTLSLEGARVREQPYRQTDELPDCLTLDFPRMKAMEQAMEQCRKADLPLIYNIEGPFTILSTLLPMNKIFAALRREQGRQILQQAEDWICQYSSMAVRHGARILSFSDPVATVDILGPKMFNQVFFPCFRSLLERIRRENPSAVLHICGKFTQSLLDTGHCRLSPWEPAMPSATYGEALSSYCQTHPCGGIIGHFCTQMLSAKRNWLYEIQL